MLKLVNGSQRSSHYGEVSHSSGSLGSVQGDAIRNINGSFGDLYTGWKSITVSESFSFVQRGTQPGGPWNGGAWYNRNNVLFNASGSVPTAEENRPVNYGCKIFNSGKIGEIIPDMR